MEDIRIYCENDNQYHKAVKGTKLKDLAPDLYEGKAIAALVDNRLKELDFSIIDPATIRFIGYDHPDGRRTYIRSLCFVLQNAVREMFPDKVLSIDYSLPSGLYCEIREVKPMDDGRPDVYFITDQELEDLKTRMQQIVDADLPFTKVKMNFEEAQKLFAANNQTEKVNLLHSISRFTYNVYFLDGKADTFYGPLAPSTGMLDTFDISGFNEGFCLQYPMDGCSGKVLPMKRQSKIATALSEHSDWCAIMGIKGIGALNKAVLNGEIIDLINLSEALHERKYAEIANQIYDRRGSVKIVFIAGPSSSGKTSTSKRLALQCRILGLNPKVIELDN